MILLDVNVLVYLHRSESPHHRKATEWYRSAVASGQTMVVWEVLLASCFRVVSQLAPTTEHQSLALRFVERIREQCDPIQPTARFWPIFLRLVNDTHATGNLVTDAMIAALAIDHDCRLATFDRDFARFKGLRWFEPS